MLKPLVGASLFFLGFAACQPENVAPDIRVENSSMRAPLPGQSTAVAYFDILNQGGKDVLLAVSSNASSRVELHNHIHEDGVMRMRQVDQVDITRAGSVAFKSGGLHVMMFDARMGKPVTLTLDFETHEDITVELETLSN